MTIEYDKFSSEAQDGGVVFRLRDVDGDQLVVRRYETNETAVETKSSGLAPVAAYVRDDEVEALVRALRGAKGR